MSSQWDQRRLTITADELMGKARTTPPTYAPPASSPLGWAQGKLSRSQGWPWREIGLTLAACFVGATLVALVLNSGWTLPSLPRRRAEASTPLPSPIVQERVVQVEQPPVIIVVTATPAPVQPAPAQPARQARPLPLPTQAPPPAAWPAPQPVTQAYGCVGLGPCNPPSAAPAKQFTGYQCPDGRFFPADGPWGMFGIGTWIVEGQGDVVNIRDTTERGSAMGWHNNCSKVWR